MVSLVLGIGADLAVTLITLLEEDAAHARSQQVVAEIVDGSVRPLRNGQTLITLSARFRDPQGKVQQATLFAGERELPAAVGQAVAAGQFPVALNIQYDPSWPGRSWIDAAVDPHHNRLYLMSFCVILFQVILGVALIALSRQPQVRVALPVEVCSFLAVAVVLAASGFGKFLLGEAF